MGAKSSKMAVWLWTTDKNCFQNHRWLGWWGKVQSLETPSKLFDQHCGRRHITFCLDKLKHNQLRQPSSLMCSGKLALDNVPSKPKSKPSLSRSPDKMSKTALLKTEACFLSEPPDHSRSRCPRAPGFRGTPSESSLGVFKSPCSLLLMPIPQILLLSWHYADLKPCWKTVFQRCVIWSSFTTFLDFHITDTYKEKSGMFSVGLFHSTSRPPQRSRVLLKHETCLEESNRLSIEFQLSTSLPPKGPWQHHQQGQGVVM